MPSLFGALRDQMRTWLNVRRDRTQPRRGSRPGIGARIAHADVRMKVQAGMSYDLWNWLQAQGWRQVNFKPDRRTYRDVPREWVTELIDCAPDDRAEALANAVAQAIAPSTAPRGDLDRPTTPTN